MPDNFLTLAQQIAAKQEAVAGTVETLTAAEVKLRPFVSTIPFSPELARFSNDEVADDIGMAPDFIGGKAGKIGFGCAFHGSGALATKPSLGIYLEACGLKEQQVNTITIGAPSGGDSAFLAGETYSAASGAKTGYIEADISGAGTLKYIILTGTALANTDTVTANGTSATCSGSSSDYAWKYSPLSYGHKTLTIQRGTKNSNGTSAKDFLVRLRGALGTGKIEGVALDALRFLGEFSGPLNFSANGSLFTGVTYETVTLAQQPKLANATIQINSVAVRPSQFSFDLGTTVELDPDPTTTGSTDGYDLARITSRKPKITIDPYRLPSDSLADLTLLSAGTVFPFSMTLGTSPNMIEISAPNCQITSWSEQDRAGRHVASLELSISRGTLTDADYAIYFR